jgi:NAD-dependent protein deacetylase/lipoamidase
MGRAVETIPKTASVAVLTGAGISVPSGLAPFRGPGGMWNDIDIDEYVTAAAFQRNRDKVIDFLDDMRKVARDAAPNEAHLALARAEAAREDNARFDIITQNIDGLHTRAGSRRVHEIHGSLEVERCESCGTLAALGETGCRCGGRWRPHVVLFGEMLPENAVRATQVALQRCDCFVAVGTSGFVWPAAGFVLEARSVGARCINVNVEKSGNDAFHEELIGRAEEILPRLFGLR